jgi:hypothetical protein
MDNDTLQMLREQAKVRRELYSNEYNEQAQLWIKQQNDYYEAQHRKKKEEEERRLNIIKDWSPQQLEWLIWEVKYATYTMLALTWHDEFMEKCEYERIKELILKVVTREQLDTYDDYILNEYRY